MKSTSWVDPKTRLMLESVDFIRVKTGTADHAYEMSYRQTLFEGPGYHW